jgi:hypothetical protein
VLIKAEGTISQLGTARPDGELGGVVEISLDLKGQAVEVPQPAKDIKGAVILKVKGLVAEKLHWGEKLYVTLSTTPPETK